MIITPKLAYRIRQRGLEIGGPSAEYSTPELEQIALKQTKLLQELKELDEAIAEMAEQQEQQEGD